jgi:hypothetical protein
MEGKQQTQWHRDIYIQICALLIKNPQIIAKLNDDFNSQVSDYRGYKKAQTIFSVKNPTECEPDFGSHHAYLACYFENRLIQKFGFSSVELESLTDGNWNVIMYKYNKPDEKKIEFAARQLSPQEFIRAAKLQLLDPLGIVYVRGEKPNATVDDKFEKYVQLYMKTYKLNYIFLEDNIYDFYNKLYHTFTGTELLYLYSKMPTWERAMLCDRLSTGKANHIETQIADNKPITIHK